jgi:hypothetical protein
VLILPLVVAAGLSPAGRQSTAPPSLMRGAPASASLASRTASQACAARDLRARVTEIVPAAGSLAAGITLRNTGVRPCSLMGVPTVALFEQDGRPIPLHASRMEDPPPPLVVLRPGATAKFGLQYPAENPHTARACEPEAAVVDITPPGDQASISTSAYPPPPSRARITPCNGRMSVFALRPAE